jgi:hypothetical protein
MYIVHIMNLKINIWTLNFLFKSKKWYFNYENCYFKFFKKYIRIWNFWFEYDIFNLNSKRLIWFKTWFWILN